MPADRLGSDVDRLAKGGERRLQGGFRQGRMGVDRMDDLLERGLEGAADSKLMDHLCRLGTDDVDAEDLARPLVGDDLDEPALELDAQTLEPETRDLRGAPDRHQHLLDLELLPAEVDDSPGATGLHGRDLDAGLDGDSAAGERPRELLRDLFVLDRHDARERLENRDLDTVRGEDVGELDPDRAGADDGDRLG